MDPYREWLGIDPKGGPPTTYRLLGLKPFETDAGTIRQAIARTRSRLEPHKRGRFAEQCRQVLDQVSRAEKVLTHPELKKSYDSGLRAKLGEQTGSQTANPAPVQGAPARPRKRIPWRPTWPHLSLEQGVKLAVGLACLTVSGVLIGRQFRGPARFPRPVGEPPKVEAARLTPARLAPRPAVPSIPGLPMGVPRKIPGLESIPNAHSPCLTADLKTIVFAAYTEVPKYDLHRASRADPNQPFRAPERIPACICPITAASPTVTPDGSELVFVQYDRTKEGELRSRLFLSTCAIPGSGTFQTPIPVPIPDLPPANVRQDVPQFLGAGLDLAYMQITHVPEGPEPHRYMVAHRRDQDGAFETPKPFPVDQPGGINFISANGLRAYLVASDSIQLCNRSSGDEPFSPPGPVQILDYRKIGPVDGPIWVAPKEDVLFYCSPGIGKPLGSARQLWMVRFR